MKVTFDEDGAVIELEHPEARFLLDILRGERSIIDGPLAKRFLKGLKRRLEGRRDGEWVLARAGCHTDRYDFRNGRCRECTEADQLPLPRLDTNRRVSYLNRLAPEPENGDTLADRRGSPRPLPGPSRKVHE